MVPPVLAQAREIKIVESKRTCKSTGPGQSIEERCRTPEIDRKREMQQNDSPILLRVWSIKNFRRTIEYYNKWNTYVVILLSDIAKT